MVDARHALGGPVIIGRGLAFIVTGIEPELVQPALSTTVTEYVPPVFTMILVDAELSLHLYETYASFRNSVQLSPSQKLVFVVKIDALRVCTKTVSLPEHAFVSVTVTMYLPALRTTSVRAVEPVFQRYASCPTPASSRRESPSHNGTDPVTVMRGER